LQLLLDGFFAEQTFPSLEFTQKLRWSELLCEDLFPKFLANLLFHGLQNLFILCFSLRPVLGLVLIGVEGIDLAERVKGRVYIQAFLLLWREKTKEFVVLGP